MVENRFNSIAPWNAALLLQRWWLDYPILQTSSEPGIRRPAPSWTSDWKLLRWFSPSPPDRDCAKAFAAEMMNEKLERELMMFIRDQYLIGWSKIFNDQVTLFRVDEDAIKVVVTERSQHSRFLADGQEAALHRWHLHDDDCVTLRAAVFAGIQLIKSSDI